MMEGKRFREGEKRERANYINMTYAVCIAALSGSAGEIKFSTNGVAVVHAAQTLSEIRERSTVSGKPNLAVDASCFIFISYQTDNQSLENQTKIV